MGGLYLAQVPADTTSPPGKLKDTCNNLTTILRTKKEGSIQAKYSPTSEEYPRRTYPDFCFGWFWVTSPKIGMALAEVGANYAEEILHMAR